MTLNGRTGPDGTTPPVRAAVRALDARLAQQPSATQALQSRCPTPIHVRFLPSAKTPPPPDILAALNLSDPTDVRTRHIRMLCKTTPLSEAWNWYVPSRLDTAMNQALEHTTHPFGKIIAPLKFQRQRLETHYPAPDSPYVLTHRALLRRESDNAPIAFVIEHYLEAAL